MRALPLAVVISCACAAKKAPPPAPVANTKHARVKSPLGLEDGAVWKFSGSYALTTVITRVDAHTFHATGWPSYGARDELETTITIDDGVVLVEDVPWIRIEPRIESVPCAEDDYCWTVEPDGHGAFDIFLRTRPDVTAYHLVPGRGITDFSYHHNGDPPDDLELHRD